MIRPTDDLSRYRVVVAPHLFILSDTAAKSLSEFVRTGGVLVSDCRTAVKDESGLCRERTLPGLLSEALGISIHEYEALDQTMRYALECKAPFSTGKPYAGVSFCDWVIPAGAEVLAGYTEWHASRYAAVTRNRFGSGLGYYVGTIVEQESFYDELMAEVLDRAGVVPVVKPPHGVEAMIREDDGKRILFLINHAEQSRTLEVPAGKRELISGKVTVATATLDPFGVMIIRL